MFLHNKAFFCIAILTIITFKGVSTSFIDYIWPKQARNLHSQEYSELNIRTIPFELAERDEKFLQHANELIGLKSSELDRCHNRVIFTLTKSCHTLNSEELGKLAVMLLNCQSAAEGRELFPCTETMSLKECTQHMSSDTWNTYHLVTNRAKAVCYRIRQEQFQGLTEITVNKLMDTAHSQLRLMADISENQKRLDEQTTDALKSVQEHNIELLEQQRSLASSQAAARAAVSGNMRALLNEKALIKSGQVEVMAVIKKLLEKLEAASTQLDIQQEQRAMNHQEILNDIKIIHENAEDVWLKIEQSTSYLTEQNSAIVEQYEKTLKQLKEINSTINYLGNVLDRTKSEIDEKLNWLNDALKGTGYTLDLVYLGLSYFFYTMVLMVICAFLNLSRVSRFLAVIIVMINFALESQQLIIANISPLDLKGLSVVIISFLSGRLMIYTAMKAIKSKMSVKGEISSGSKKLGMIGNLRNNNSNSMRSTNNTDSAPNLPTIHEFEQRSYLEHADTDRSERGSSVDTEILPHFNRSEYMEAVGTPSDFTPPVSRNDFNHSLRFRSNTPNSLARKFCEAKTRKGEFCKNYSIFGRDFCSRHQLGSSIIGELS